MRGDSANRVAALLQETQVGHLVGEVVAGKMEGVAAKLCAGQPPLPQVPYSTVDGGRIQATADRDRHGGSPRNRSSDGLKNRVTQQLSRLVIVVATNRSEPIHILRGVNTNACGGEFDHPPRRHGQNPVEKSLLR